MKIYIATLYRFGYDLTVVSKNKKRCEELLLEEYAETYKNINETDSKKDIAYDRNSELSYYDLAKDDIEISEHELDKVEWR